MPTPTTREQIQEEVSKNYEFFQAYLKENKKTLFKEHKDEVALIRRQKIVNYFDDYDDALEYGRKKYKDRLFSVQEVNEAIVDLGYMGYALF